MVSAASAMKPSFSTVTSSFKRSPSRSARSPGIPCTASSFTLMQFAPGKPYTLAGADRAPFASMVSRPIRSSSAVVTPGLTCFFIASSTRRTTTPAARNASNSSGVPMDTIISSKNRTANSRRGLPELRPRPARSKEQQQDESRYVEGCHLGKRKPDHPQHETKQRDCFRKRVRHHIPCPPSTQGRRIIRTRRQRYGRLHYQRAPHHQDHSHDGDRGHRQGIEQGWIAKRWVTEPRIRPNHLSDDHEQQHAHQHGDLKNAHDLDRGFHCAHCALISALASSRFSNSAAIGNNFLRKPYKVT